MFASNVAPRRRVRERRKPWRCGCGQQLAGYLVRCPTCGGRPAGDGCRVHDAHAASLYREELG